MIKYSLKKFDKEFATDTECLDWLFNYRYPQGVNCPVCQKITKHYKINNRTAYECELCGNQVYPMVGTIFEKSSTPLRTWFHAIFLMSNTRCGISAKQLERETGVTYKTAWRMFKQIRTLLDENNGIFKGEIEADETYIGGARRGKRGRGASGKTIVAGVVERKGKISTKIVPDVKANTLIPIIQQKVASNSTVFTDEMPSYNRLERLGFNHEVIKHADKVYVNGNIHTNTVDGFWGLVKGGIKGVYHHVSPEYLDSYVNEYEFRYNHRKDETPMFKTFLNRI